VACTGAASSVLISPRVRAVDVEDSQLELLARGWRKGLATSTATAIHTFLADQAQTYAPATVSVRYRVFQQFFKWLRDPSRRN
jgi:hypothetical protein